MLINFLSKIYDMTIAFANKLITGSVNLIKSTCFCFWNNKEINEVDELFVNNQLKTMFMSKKNKAITLISFIILQTISQYSIIYNYISYYLISFVIFSFSMLVYYIFNIYDILLKFIEGEILISSMFAKKTN